MQNSSSVNANSESSPQQKLREVEELTNTLKRLLVQHESALDEEDIRREVEILERWTESYRRGLSAADKISETGVGWLSSLRDRLKLAAHEKLRLEDEGGSPVNKDQATRAEQLLQAASHIDKAIPDIEHIIASHHHKESEPA